MEVMIGDIEVNRVNDKVYYPGRPSYGELEVTFDNLLRSKTGFQLYKYFQTVWDPQTGKFQSRFLDSPDAYKTNIEVLELNGRMEPQTVTKLIGAYPKRWSKAEKNYSTEEFDTVSCVFRYDMIIQEGDVVN